MKKTLILAAVSVFGFISFAQAQATSSTNVKINLTDFITTEPGNQTVPGQTPGAAAVEFSYPNAASYTVDQVVSLAGHLKVTATKIFQVTVKAAGANFVNGTNNIPVGVMDITPTVPAGSGGTATKVTLTAAEQPILTGVKAGIQTIDVKYSIPADRAQKDILGKPQGTYQQTIVYTFTQP
ncbi:hypothetical protein ACFSPU_05220 [Haoranjiania flava]|uniref:Adhesin n=1 Tax=Haoranjiania flava TaxID=1856322 RepID=A0AAE3IK97_9BACT|nr:hypothetical protein [Haoranjiania flava]MCU7693727.1 hypothetical protein [Haoranjiania flava]